MVSFQRLRWLKDQRSLFIFDSMKAKTFTEFLLLHLVFHLQIPQFLFTEEVNTFVGQGLAFESAFQGIYPLQKTIANPGKLFIFKE
jgi:hypothetical protein